ncbi:MAG: DUF2959 family protein, partial [Burkholderiaceae bacterium]
MNAVPAQAAQTFLKHHPTIRFVGRSVAAVCIAVALGSCQTAYYAAMEKVGFEKRDILSNRVEDARDAQV